MLRMKITELIGITLFRKKFWKVGKMFSVLFLSFLPFVILWGEGKLIQLPKSYIPWKFCTFLEMSQHFYFFCQLLIFTTKKSWDFQRSLSRWHSQGRARNSLGPPSAIDLFVLENANPALCLKISSLEVLPHSSSELFELTFKWRKLGAEKNTFLKI